MREVSMNRMGMVLVLALMFLPTLSHAATLAELQAQVQALMAQITALQTQTKTTAVAPQSGAASCPNLTRNLSRGIRGDDVKQLQQFLLSQNLLASDSTTGFFGAMTETAVKLWQKSNDIISTGSAATTGYGAVGPKTRFAITRCVRPNVAVKSEIGKVCGAKTPSCVNNCDPVIYTYANSAAMESDNARLINNGVCSPFELGTSGNIGEMCKVWFDGCNECKRTTPGGTSSCTSNSCSLSKGAQCSQTFERDSSMSANVPSPNSDIVLPPPTCAPLPSQLQTLACPTGQSGSITQTRASSCVSNATSPTWSDWMTNTNSCATPQRTVVSGAIDPVEWMTTNKGTGHVRGYFETWNGNTWVSGTGGVAQPFKMFADAVSSQIYWRKDMPAETQRGDGKNYEFSGEIYTFDASSVRLRAESFYFFPCPALDRCDPVGQAWDIRADKFRLFVDGTGPLDTTEGLFFMPRPVWNGWSHGPYPLATYYCNSFSEFHQSTCSQYQKSDLWGWVTVEAYNNYDIFNADGDQVVATPDGTPQQRIYDVLIVSQEQQVTNFSESVPAGTARGVARERFFYGKIGNDKYGFIRWDSAKNVNGRYVLDARTIGYAWDTSYNPLFSDMQARGAEER